MPSSIFQAVRKSRILIVEDHELVRAGLIGLVGKQPDLEICGEATDVKEAREMVKAIVPDLAIVDLRLPDGSGLDLVNWIIAVQPSTKVIVSTVHDEREYGERVLRLGARGFVNKNSSGHCILVAIRKVLSGELFFSQAFTSQMLQRVSLHSAKVRGTPTATLSDRELEVLELIGRGHSTKMIARHLFLSENTIWTYRDRLKSKLNLRNSAELTRFAIRRLEDL